MNQSSQSTVPPVIPDHQLLRCIGQGAYGEIWLARNVIGTYRAVKIVFRARFENIKPYEREFAGLQAFEPVSRSHPGLVDILQVGRNDDAGYMYYVMELADDEVDGARVHPDSYAARTLGRDLARHGRLPAEEAIRISIKLAEGLAHLHDAALVHRDIKPSNIIFVNGDPKLADVGLVVSLSAAHTFVGSEGYIPPEGPGTIQADIYSFGKVIYEISTGQDKDAFPELPQDIGEYADRESVVELNEVVVKACANKPATRYHNAHQLRADLEMILAGRSVKRLHFVESQLARVRRVAIGAVLIALAAGVLAFVANRVRQREKELLAKAYVTSGIQFVNDGNPHAALPWFAQALRLQQPDGVAADAHRVRIGMALQQAPKLVQFWDRESPVVDLAFSSNGRRLLVAAFRQVRVLDIATGATVLEIEIARTVYNAAFSHDGRRIAVCNGHYLTMFDADTGAQILQIKQPGFVVSVDFSRDDTKILLGCDDHCARVLDPHTGEPIGADLSGHTGEVSRAIFSPDGETILTCGRDGTARLWDAHTHKVLHVMRHAEWVQDADFSPDGKRFVTASSDHTLFLWDIFPTPRVTARMQHRGNVQRARFSPDGRWIVSAAMDHTVRFWDAKTGKLAGSTINMTMPVLNACFSPEGRRVACAGQSGRIKMWDIAVETPLNVGPGTMSGNGERYVTFASNSFRIWDARNDAPLSPVRNVTESIRSIACDANASTLLLTTTNAGRKTMDASIYDLRTDTERRISPLMPKPVIALSATGDTLIMATNRMAMVWDTATGRLLFPPMALDSSVNCAAFSPDGQTIALGSRKNLFVFEARTGRERFPPLGYKMRVGAVAFNHDGSRLLCATRDDSYDPGEATILDAHTGQPVAHAAPHSDGIVATSFSHDGKIAVTGGEDSFVFVWNAATGRSQADPLALSWQLQTVEFSLDDRWVIAASRHDAAVWEVQSGRAVTPIFTRPTDYILDSGFCAGGRRIWLNSDAGLLFYTLPRAAAGPEEVLALADQLGVSVPESFEWSTNSLPTRRRHEMCDHARAEMEMTMASWHSQQAQLSERERDWFAAEFHLNQMLERAPQDLPTRARLEMVRSHRTGIGSSATDLPANP